MKQPEALADRLARQWDEPAVRADRLLSADAWPIRLPIAKPRPRDIEHNLNEIKAALSKWRAVTVGRVHWQAVRYRALASELDVPVAWELRKPSEWVDATGVERVKREFKRLSAIIAGVDPDFHKLLLRRRSLIDGIDVDDIVTAAQIASQLEPGYAQGLPLRALSFEGIDTKFFERHRSLMTKLLDVRFEGGVSELGLEAFLDAQRESAQWLLVCDLDGGLLPFSQVRVRDTELNSTALPGTRVLVVENEQCLHQLPALAETVAVLGAGLNLNWMGAPWLQHRDVAYWGDIDTWGLSMLARAREQCRGLTALLMDAATFAKFGERYGVAEPVIAQATPPGCLSHDEALLYRQLVAAEQGRLEQEFLPSDVVADAIRDWAG